MSGIIPAIPAIAWMLLSCGIRAENLSEKYQKEILPIMVNHCYDCHGDGSSKGHLELDRWKSIEEMISDRPEWQKIRDHIDFRLMHPPDEYAPSDADRATLVKWIDDAVFHVDAKNPDPGRVTLRRLNRTEYQNTIRDLLGVNVEVTDILPPDDSGYGFDNIANVLSLSPLHMVRFLEAAEVSLDMAVNLSPPKFPKVDIKGQQLLGAGNRSGSALMLSTSGEGTAYRKINHGGRFQVTVRARAESAGDEAAKMELKINDRSIHIWDVSDANGTDYRSEISLEGGKNAKVTVGFLNDYYDESQPEGQRDRNLLVENVEIQGPVDGPPLGRSGSHRKIFTARNGGTDEEYMTSILKPFLERAFRRPAQPGEVERYLIFLKSANADGEGVEHAIRHALAAVLVSPSFLFREEPVLQGSGKGKSLIDEHALASRLSYFLWSTMPDAQLRELADKGELRKNLHSEIRRMVASEKSRGFVENFVGQWLQLRDMESVSPHNEVFRDFDRATARDFRTETESLVRHIMEENLPVRTLLDADFTFINERLAKLYGINGVEGEEFRMVSLEGTPRRGLLGQGSFLTLTSHSTRTSPVLRGKYILENILNTPPPPAPPNVPTLRERREHDKDSLTLRQELEAHRKDPACASCHALMDPIGFGLENYDAIGRWRTEDRGKPLEVAGRLVTGQEFSSAEELRDIFINDYTAEFHRAVAVKMLTYALGRGVEYYDRPAIDGMVLKASKDDGRFLSWVTAVAESVPFQYRRN